MLRQAYLQACNDMNNELNTTYKTYNDEGWWKIWRWIISNPAIEKQYTETSDAIQFVIDELDRIDETKTEEEQPFLMAQFTWACAQMAYFEYKIGIPLHTPHCHRIFEDDLICSPIKRNR